MTKILAFISYFCKIYPPIRDLIIGFRSGISAEKEEIARKKAENARKKQISLMIESENSISLGIEQEHKDFEQSKEQEN